jgi:dihydrofolate reductase
MITIIAAVSENNVIGNENKLPWYLPEDLENFKRVTLGKKIIMGRKTFESLPKVLPNRHHIVITNNYDYKIDDDRVTVVNSIKHCLEILDKEEDVFVIGGEQIYRQFIDLADKLIITKVHKEVEGDTYFPEIDNKKWKEESVVDYKDFSIVTYSC